MASNRRLPDNCYLCGDPAVDGWHCVAHLWASSPNRPVPSNGIERITREHAFWIERFTPEQIVELAGYLERNGVAA